MSETQQKIDNILKSLSQLMGSPIEYRLLQEDQGRVLPVYDVNGIISKMVALLVYSGLSVPSTFGPPYNRVHADIEWWKKFFEAVPAPLPALEPLAEQPAEQPASQG